MFYIGYSYTIYEREITIFFFISFHHVFFSFFIFLPGIARSPLSPVPASRDRPQRDWILFFPNRLRPVGVGDRRPSGRGRRPLAAGYLGVKNFFFSSFLPHAGEESVDYLTQRARIDPFSLFVPPKGGGEETDCEVLLRRWLYKNKPLFSLFLKLGGK